MTRRAPRRWRPGSRSSGRCGGTTRSSGSGARASCANIERVFRGNLGRRACRARRAARGEQAQAAMFAYFASVIQHCFRGFRSRRYKHDYYARKAYIQNILEKSNQLRGQLAANRQRAAADEQERRMREMQAEFKAVAANLHHLLSTRARPGIYNSPFALDGPPTAFGKPIEEHLVACTQEVLRSQGMRSVALAEQVARPRIKQSVQASSEYGAASKEHKHESRRSKMMRVCDREFRAGGKGPLTDLNTVTPVSTGTPFVDQHKIQKSTRDRPLARSQKPFHNAVPKNQLFDSIMDQALEVQPKPS